MSNLHKLATTILLILLSPFGWGWNNYGHLLVSDLAVAELTPAKQRAYEQMAYSLVRQMDSQKRLYLMRTFEGTSAVAQLSVFPDEWRGRTISQLYDTYADGLPSSLAPYAESTSDSWHYINQVYQRDSSTPACHLDQQENVVSVIPDLLAAYRESASEANRAVTLAFILHMVADVHNPLHTITKMDDDCKSDRGGNLFCVAYHRGARSCEQNLHQAWDGAVGFFAEHEKIADAIHYVSYVEVDPEAAANLEPSDWAKEGFDFARFIYSAQEGEKLDPYYAEEGKIISYEQLALAAARLAAILDSL